MCPNKHCLGRVKDLLTYCVSQQVFDLPYTRRYIIPSLASFIESKILLRPEDFFLLKLKDLDCLSISNDRKERVIKELQTRFKTKTILQVLLALSIEGVNKAFIELTRHCGGPVHINLESEFSKDYSIKCLPKVRKISFISQNDKFPDLPKGRIAIYCSSHLKWKDEEFEALEKFCETHDAVVFCDQTSNYKGKYRVLSALIFSQVHQSKLSDVDLLIHIGSISGDYYSSLRINANQVWRVSEEGEIRDTFRKLTNVFEMSEKCFFQHYSDDAVVPCLMVDSYSQAYNNIVEAIPEIPFSNIYIAKKLAPSLPHNSVLHLGILNSLRSWNYFEIDKTILSYSNVGGFGIDGDMSSLIGASLVNPKKLYFGVFGDLAFFYDMNSLGNHNVGNNVRILLINNGRGTEFRNYSHDASRFGDDADLYIAAAGHYGSKSQELVKHYATDLGFEYLSASSKEEFEYNYLKFVSDQITSRPIIFECFTDTADENDALYIINHIAEKDINDYVTEFKTKTKKMARAILGDDNVQRLKEHLQ